MAIGNYLQTFVGLTILMAFLIEKTRQSNSSSIKNENQAYPESCAPACKDCSKNPESCTSCSEQFQLFQESPDSFSCLRITCNDYCSKCVAINVCEECINSDYYIAIESPENKVCKKKIKVGGSLKETSLSPKLFELRFTDVWTVLFSTLPNRTSVIISNMEAKHYFCQIIADTAELQLFFVHCNYFSEVNSNSLLSIKIYDYPANTEKSAHYLEKDFFEIKLGTYRLCNQGEAWNQATKTCTAPVYITPYLRLTNDPRIVIYGFDSQIPYEFEKYFENLTKITIISLNHTYYSSKISKSTNEAGRSSTFEIELYYDQQIDKQYILDVTFWGVSPVLQSDESVVFTKFSAQVELLNYYMLSSESEKLVEDTAKAIYASSIAADQAFIISNFIIMGSSFMIKSLFADQFIQLMRFVHINYPPNLLEVYKYKLGRSIPFPEFDISEDSGDGIAEGIFYQNEVSIYFLNNCGTILVIFYVLAFIGLLLKLTEINLRTFLIKNKNILPVFGMVYDFFVWNFPLAYLLAKFQTISYFLALALHNPKTKTVKSRVNFAISVISLIIIYLLPVLIVLVLKKMIISAKLISITKTFSQSSKPNRESFNVNLIKKKDKNSNLDSLREDEDSDANKNDKNLTEEDKSPYFSQTSGQTMVNMNIKNGQLFTTLPESSNIKPLTPININGDSKISALNGLSKQGIGKEGHQIEINDKRGHAQDGLVGDKKTKNGGNDWRTPNMPDQIFEENLKQAELETYSTINKNKVLKSRLNSRGQDEDAFTERETPKKKNINLKHFFKFFFKTSEQGNINILKNKKAKFSIFISQPSTTKNMTNYLDGLKRNFQVFQNEYKIDQPISHYHLLLEIVRQILITIILVSLENHPLAQTILNLIINFLFLLIIFLVRPYSKLEAFLQICAVEVMLLSASLGFLTLAIMDASGKRDLNIRMDVGWWICYSNMAIILFMLTIFTFDLVLFLTKAVIFFRSELANRRNNKIARGEI